MCRSCINIERAKLDPFTERGREGNVWFANRVRAKGEARRWIPMNPLQAYAMGVEDVHLAKRRAAKQPA